MKRLLALLFIFTAITLYSQSDKGDTAGGTTPTMPNSPTDPYTDEDAKGLDREFYTTYFMMDPLQYDKKEEKAKKEANILRVLRREIETRDPYNKEVLADLNANNVQIVRVTEDTFYIRKLMERVNHLRLTDYMYIAKFKNYICLMLFEASPGKYFLSPTYIELVYPRAFLLPTKEEP